jgi:mycothiol synthase
MQRLSNFFRPRDQGETKLGQAVNTTCRPIVRQELESALRLILVNDNGLAGDEAVLEFLGFAAQRKIELGLTWVALLGDKIAWSLLPITSPGRTMLLFTPNRIPRATPIELARELTQAVCAYWRDRGMHLAQFLLDPADRSIIDLYASAGFDLLAELIYLQRTVNQTAGVEVPAGVEILHYSAATHGAFAETILRSYEGSLDCPALNGRRDIEDVMTGHKSTGEFDPKLWFLLRQGSDEQGVLILSPVHHSNSLELVYLGLTPEARGKGLANLLMRLALASVQPAG